MEKEIKINNQPEKTEPESSNKNGKVPRIVPIIVHGKRVLTLRRISIISRSEHK